MIRMELQPSSTQSSVPGKQQAAENGLASGKEALQALDPSLPSQRRQPRMLPSARSHAKNQFQPVRQEWTGHLKCRLGQIGHQDGTWKQSPAKAKQWHQQLRKKVVQGGEPSDQVPAANAAQASSDVPRKEAKPVKGDKKGKGKAASSEAASAANVEGVSGSSAQPGHQAAAGSLAGQESLGLDSLPSSADDSPQPQADAAPKQSSGQIMHYCCVQEEQQARAMRAESCG